MEEETCCLTYSRNLVCTNATTAGVTLLPLISKISCRMRLERIKKGMDRKLRKEQAGF